MANVQVMQAEHGNEHDVAVAEYVQSVGQVFKNHSNAEHIAKLCTAIDHMPYVRHSEEIESLMEVFDQAHSDNSNIML